VTSHFKAAVKRPAKARAKRAALAARRSSLWNIKLHEPREFLKVGTLST